MSENRVQIVITAEGQDAERTIKTLSARLGDMGQSAKASMGELDKSGAQAGTSVRDLDTQVRESSNSLAWFGAAAAAAAVGGLYALNRGSARAVELADAQAQAENKLQAVLLATGEAAGYNHAELVRMAEAMQSATTVGDEVVLTGMSILATFKEIRGEAFERATMAALDMSRVMGQDLRTSIVQIGKAMNDPIANLSALSRTGVQFTAEQQEMVKALWEAGDAAGAQAVILAELESQFGGAAAAVRQTYGGMRAAVKNAYGDMYEQLGFVITKNQFFIDLMGVAEQQFISWGGQIEDNRDMLAELAKNGILFVVDALALVLRTIGFMHTAWLNMKLVADSFIHLTIQGLDWIFGRLRVVLTPFVYVLEAARKLGLIDANPLTSALDAINSELQIMLKSTDEVARETAVALLAAEQRYAAWGGAIQDVRNKLADIPVVIAESGEESARTLSGLAGATSKSLEESARTVDGLAGAASDLLEGMSKEGRDALARLSDEWAKLTLSAQEYERLKIFEWYEKEKAALGGTHPLLEKVLQAKLAINAVDSDAVNRMAEIEADKLRLQIEFADRHRQVVLGETEYKIEQLRIQADAYVEAGSDEIAVAQWVAQERLALSREWSAGAIRGLREYKDDATNTARHVEDVFIQGFKGMTDSLVEFTKTGRFDFSNFADSLISDLLRIFYQSQVVGPLAGALGDFLGSLFRGEVSDSMPGLRVNATGGVYNAPGLSAYSNQIVTQPTLFEFAKGMGVMGEAGWEAILPLTRTSSGNLGVEAKVHPQPQVVRVEIINESGQHAEIRDAEVNFDLQGMVVSVWLDALNRNVGGLRTALGG